MNEDKTIQIPDRYTLRLPTEAEWEKAARGEYGNIYPWGNDFDRNKCNSIEGGKADTTPIGFYSPQGDSPYNCADMVGNVWEWTHSLYKGYPYDILDGREAEVVEGGYILRGGSFGGNEKYVRCAYRVRVYALNRNDDFGFRLAVAPILAF